MIKKGGNHINIEDIELNIVLLQVDSIQSEPQRTYDEKVVQMLSKFKESDIDIIIFPELAFTGYIFSSREEIYPLCEEAGKGLHSKIASEISKMYNSYVAIGYPEKDEDDNLYNSCMIFDRTGQLIFNYRKILLYDADKLYFSEGDERKTFELVTLKGKSVKTTVAICMDINYKDFKNHKETPLSDFCEKEKVELLLFLTAWCTKDEKPIKRALLDEKSEAEKLSSLI